VSTGDPLLDVSELHAGYGSLLAVNGISLQIGVAETVALIGRNGAGKTTSLLAIAGLRYGRFPGHVTLGGVDVSKATPRQLVEAGLAHVPEGQGVIAELTVQENLRLGAFWRSGRATRAGALAEAYQRFPVLAGARNRAAGTLSGGERQMLVIARALMSRPRVLLLDEPSLGLAPKIVSQVMELTAGLRESGLTVLLVEQNARSALSIADQGIVLNLGKVVMAADAVTLAADVGLRKHYLGF